jgi:hypothetical protein
MVVIALLCNFRRLENQHGNGVEWSSGFCFRTKTSIKREEDEV